MSQYAENIFSLKGRIALITGASSGIGYHMARTFAQAGADCICLGRNLDALQKLQSEIEVFNQKAIIHAIDLSSIEDWNLWVEQSIDVEMSPDILVNAAGVNFREPTEDVSQKSWNDTINLNLSIPFFIAQALVPKMKNKGYGNIINIASLQSYRAFDNGIAYGASKGGITQLTRAMAQSWSRHDITANAIAPGFFLTKLTGPVFNNKEVAQHHAQATCIGRNGKMEDLTGLSIFLASRASSYITGQTIAADGGYLAK